MKNTDYDEPIEKNESNFIVGLGIFIVIVVISAIVTVFLSDKRENATQIGELNFNNTVFDVVSYKKESGSQKAQLEINELYMIGTEKSFDLTIKDDLNITITSDVKQGQTIEEEQGGMILQTNYHINFSTPKKAKYIKFIINKDSLEKTFTIDLRDFREVKKITE